MSVKRSPFRSDDEAIRKLVQLISRAAERSHSSVREVWVKFVAIMAAIVDRDVATALRLEAELAPISEQIEAAGDIIIAQAKNNYRDILGPAYMQLAARKGQGQFFTPWDMCVLTARLTFGNKVSSLRPITVGDPCCGSGGMLLAAAEHLTNIGLQPTEFWLYGADIDPMCVQMCHVNLEVRGLWHMVEARDALTNK